VKVDVGSVKVCVHSFNMADVDDPQLYAAGPIWEWSQSDVGKWVTENCNDEPVFHTFSDFTTFGYKVKIIANLQEDKASYFLLKYGNFK
jgi:hypothetical protein